MTAAEIFLNGFSLGKYAAFVVPAYAVSAVGFTWMIGDTVVRGRRWRREVARLESRKTSDGPDA